MPPPSTGRGGLRRAVGHTHPCAFGVGATPLGEVGACASPAGTPGASDGDDDAGGGGAAEGGRIDDAGGDGSAEDGHGDDGGDGSDEGSLDDDGWGGGAGVGEFDADGSDDGVEGGDDCGEGTGGVGAPDKGPGPEGADLDACARTAGYGGGRNERICPTEIR
jgi:hypothetical protein